MPARPSTPPETETYSPRNAYEARPPTAVTGWFIQGRMGKLRKRYSNRTVPAIAVKPAAETSRMGECARRYSRRTARECVNFRGLFGKALAERVNEGILEPLGRGCLSGGPIPPPVLQGGQ